MTVKTTPRHTHTHTSTRTAGHTIGCLVIILSAFHLRDMEGGLNTHHTHNAYKHHTNMSPTLQPHTHTHTHPSHKRYFMCVIMPAWESLTRCVGGLNIEHLLPSSSLTSASVSVCVCVCDSTLDLCDCVMPGHEGCGTRESPFI